jgi:pheromone a factor receptor
VAVIFRLRKHRGQLSGTLSSTGSGLDARKFLKLFFMSCSILLVYLPVECYFFYFNMPDPFVPYSWSRIHDPASWNLVLYFHTSEEPAAQFLSWPGVSIGFLVFLWYGLNIEAIEKYIYCAVKCGFARIWPILTEPYQPRRRGSAGGSRTTWTSHFDVISKAVQYLDGARKQSQVTSMGGPESESQGYVPRSSPFRRKLIFSTAHIPEKALLHSTKTLPSQARAPTPQLPTLT